ncbi:hypothetical protein EDB92DRAFT_683670 [Lactarius akahatsu]|uniref:Uncharacterized protein n=1 Tax=Lactarius akahatsu TaxID=416441 RepID=A0AAD4QDG4_9AGAM|nr:hypothetical protein EDB92DRAFT_683670 [Lactarius akahatsu]
MTARDCRTSCASSRVLQRYAKVHEHAVVDFRQRGLDPPGAPETFRYASYGRAPPGRGTFNQQGDRGRPRSCIPRSKTPSPSLWRDWREIPSRMLLSRSARHSVTHGWNSCMWRWNRRQTTAGTHADAIRASPGDFVLIDAQAADSFERVKRAPETRGTEPSAADRRHADAVRISSTVCSPSLVGRVVYPVDEHVLAHVGSAQKSSPLPTEAIPSMQYSVSSSLAGRAPAPGELGHSNWADALV